MTERAVSLVAVKLLQMQPRNTCPRLMDMIRLSRSLMGGARDAGGAGGEANTWRGSLL